MSRSTVENLRRSCSVAVLTLLAGATAASAQDALRGDALIEKIDSLAAATIDRGESAGLAIGVRIGDDVVLQKGYGHADLELDVPVAPETVFRIGSITKQFTAAAIMKRVESGEIELDAPITDYLPDYPMQGRTVTVRDLLDHTSGIRSYTGMESWAEMMVLPMSDEEMVGLFSAEPFDFEPGEEYRYNNSGYFLLGVILSELSGMPYRELVEAEIFAPLGMEGSSYCDERRIIPHRAEGYEATSGGLMNDAPLSMDHPGAAGALCSTVPDLLRWADALRDGEYVSPESYTAMSTSSTLNDGSEIGYGFGLGVNEIEGHPVVAHGGGINGFATMLAHLPELDADVVVLSNTAGGHPGRLALAIERWLLGVEADPVLDLEMEAEALEMYVGTYELMPEMQLEVTVRDDGLYAQATGQGAFRLRAQGDHAFIPTFDDTARITFRLEGGEVVGLTLLQGGGEIRAPKIN